MKPVRKFFYFFLAVLMTTVAAVHAVDAPVTDHLVLWLKADSLKLKNGYYVEKWDDSSPGHNTAANSVPDCQPTFVTNGVCGKAAVRFDGMDDFLKVAPVRLPKGFAYVVVMRTTSKASAISYPGNASSNLFGDHRGSVCASFGIRNGSIQYNYLKGGNDDWHHFTMSKAINDGIGRIVILTHGASDGLVDLYVNGNLEVSDYASYYANATGFDRIASGYAAEDDKSAGVFEGDIAEILVYDIALPDEDRLAVENYLGAKYNILPAGYGVLPPR